MQLFEATVGDSLFEVANYGHGSGDEWDYTDLTDRAVAAGQLMTLGGSLENAYFQVESSAQLNAAPGTSTISWQEIGVDGQLEVQLVFPSATVQQAINTLETVATGASAAFEVSWQIAGERDGQPFSIDFVQGMTLVKTH